MKRSNYVKKRVIQVTKKFIKCSSWKTNDVFSKGLPNKVNENKIIIKYTYLEADLIAGLFGIAFDSVGRSHGWSVNGTIVSNYESVTSVVQLQPIKNGTTCDDRARQGGETMQIAG